MIWIVRTVSSNLIKEIFKSYPLEVAKGDQISILSNITIVLALFMFSLLAFYLISAYKSLRKSKSSERKKEIWDKKISSHIENNDKEVGIEKSNEFRDHLVECAKEEKFPVSKIKEIYHKYGFSKQDSKDLESEKWWEITGAINRMKILGIDEEEEKIADLLMHEKVEVRLNALDMLAEIKSNTLYHVIPDIFEVNSDNVKEYLILKLFEADIPPTYFQPLFVSGKNKLRYSAAVMIGKKGNEEAIPYLNSLSQDSEEEIRIEAVRSLGRTEIEDAIPILQQKIQDESREVRCEVAKALGRIGSKSAVPILEEMLGDEVYDVRLEAYLALRKFGNEGREIIKKHEDKNPMAAKEAIVRSVFVKGARIDV